MMEIAKKTICLMSFIKGGINVNPQSQLDLLPFMNSNYKCK